MLNYLRKIICVNFVGGKIREIIKAKKPRQKNYTNQL